MAIITQVNTNTDPYSNLKSYSQFAIILVAAISLMENFIVRENLKKTEAVMKYRYFLECVARALVILSMITDMHSMIAVEKHPINMLNTVQLPPGATPV